MPTHMICEVQNNLTLPVDLVPAGTLSSPKSTTQSATGRVTTRHDISIWRLFRGSISGV